MRQSAKQPTGRAGLSTAIGRMRGSQPPTILCGESPHHLWVSWRTQGSFQADPVERREEGQTPQLGCAAVYIGTRCNLKGPTLGDQDSWASNLGLSKRAVVEIKFAAEQQVALSIRAAWPASLIHTELQLPPRRLACACMHLIGDPPRQVRGPPPCWAGAAHILHSRELQPAAGLAASPSNPSWHPSATIHIDYAQLRTGSRDSFPYYTYLRWRSTRPAIVVVAAVLWASLLGSAFLPSAVLAFCYIRHCPR